MVSASDWWLSVVVARLGSFCARDVKLEPNLCLDGSERVFEIGVKFSLWAAQIFLSSLGLDV